MDNLQKEEEIVLSICIPTYNRRKYLECAVNSALAIYRPQIEIVISDNCSSDDTKSYCRKLVAADPRIKYIRNSENIGSDGNFLQLLKSARGKYIHILSDDDEVRCRDIGKFLDFLRENDFSLGELYSGLKGDETDLSGKETKIYPKAQVCDFIRAHGIYLTNVSSLLFRRDAFERIRAPERYKNTYLLQTCIAAEILRDGTGADIYDYYVAATPNTSGSYNIYEVFIKNWHYILFDVMRCANIPKRFLRKQFRRDLTFSFRYLLGEKAHGIDFITKPKWRYFKYSFSYAYGIFVILPVLLMPKFMIGLAYRVYRKIKHKEKTV